MQVINRLLLLLLSALSAAAQNQNGSAILSAHVVVIRDEVVHDQWPVLGEQIIPPAYLKQVGPGDCVRFAVAAAPWQAGMAALKQARLEFEMEHAGQTQTFAGEVPEAVKHTSPISVTFMLQTLKNDKLPKKSAFAEEALAASKARWCAPAELQDGSISVKCKVMPADGSTVHCDSLKIDARTFESARKHQTLKKDEAFGEWFTHYHLAPNAALLLPALRITAPDPKARDEFNTMFFFAAALKANPIAAEELMRRLPQEEHWVQLYSTAVLGWAGYSTGALMAGFPEAERTMIQSLNHPDPFDMSPGPDIGARQDMLWAIFFATGNFEPVRAIAGELAWGEEYDKFEAITRSGEKKEREWDSFSTRAVGYATAGWSMASLSSNDALLEDYIGALQCSPGTPVSVKKELANLYTNPAFQMDFKNIKKRQLKDPPRDCSKP